jgi:hypothetical protein
MPIPAPRWTALAVAALLATTAWAAPGTPVKDDKAGDSPAEKVKKALDQTTEINLENATLETAINQLAEAAKVNLVVDRWTLQNMGFDPNQLPVNLKLKDAKIRTALHAILNPYNLGYAVVGDTVVITTEDLAIHRQMKQRVSVDYENVQLGTALKKLAKETGTSIVLDGRSAKEAETAVTLQLDDVPLETAVRLAAEMGGLKPVRVGNVLFVTSKANAKEIKAEMEPPAPQGGQPIPYEILKQQQIQQIQQLQLQLANPPGFPPHPGQPAPSVVPMDVPPVPVPAPQKEGEKKDGDKPPPPEQKGDK